MFPPPKTVNTSPTNTNAGQSACAIRVCFSGRDSFWADRHVAEPEERVLKARKKWQCQACGECGFVETVFGEERLVVVRRTGHGCPPERISLFAPGAHRPLES
jgi:hypothetical protein